MTTETDAASAARAPFSLGFYDQIEVYNGDGGVRRQRCFNVCDVSGRHVAYVMDDRDFALALVSALNNAASGCPMGWAPEVRGCATEKGETK